MSDKLKNEKAELPSLLSPQKIGEGLHEISAELVETGAEPLMTRWFRSEPETDVLYWIDSRKNVIKQQISFYGQVVEWNIIEGIRTGVKVEVEVSGQENPLEGLHYDTAPMRFAVGQAIRVLNSARQIHENERLMLVANFEKNPTVERMDMQEFCEKFGKNGERESAVQAFLSKVKKLLKL